MHSIYENIASAILILQYCSYALIVQLCKLRFDSIFSQGQTQGEVTFRYVEIRIVVRNSAVQLTELPVHLEMKPLVNIVVQTKM